MRSFVLVPILLVMVVAIGLAVCHAVGLEFHAKEVMAAALVCLFAGELAGAPLLLNRGVDQATMAQSALVGTVIHLFVCIAVAAVVLLGHLPLGPSFVYWLLVLYWVTLIALVIGFAQAVRSAPTAGTSRQ